MHRADASGLELSDASLSAALLTLGTEDEGVFEMGEDGYPVVWMKLSRKQDDTHVEVKPYRSVLLCMLFERYRANLPFIEHPLSELL